MKRIISIIIALSMCISLAACGGDTPAANENPQSSTTDSTVVESTSNTNSEASLPMNVGEAYACNIGGYDGFVYVDSYEVFPDDMNPGCEIRTAHVTAVFPGAEKGLDLGTVTFVADAENGTPQTLDETAWIMETEDGEALIFEYDNSISAGFVSDGVLRYEILLSYVVPEYYDEIAFAITDTASESALDSLSKADVVSSSTSWFIMGGFDNGVLTYNGNAMATAAATADVNEMFSYGTPPADWATEEIPDAPYDEPYEEEGTTSASGYRTLSPIQFGAITECSAEGRSLSFGAIELVECYEDTNVINVTINYSGHQNGDTIHTLMYDAYNELHLDEQEEPVSGNGSVTFVFSCPANTAPYTFSMITKHNGQFIQNNIHIDVDVY